LSFKLKTSLIKDFKKEVFKLIEGLESEEVKSFFKYNANQSFEESGFNTNLYLAETELEEIFLDLGDSIRDITENGHQDYITKRFSVFYLSLNDKAKEDVEAAFVGKFKYKLDASGEIVLFEGFDKLMQDEYSNIAGTESLKGDNQHNLSVISKNERFENALKGSLWNKRGQILRGHGSSYEVNKNNYGNYPQLEKEVSESVKILKNKIKEFVSKAKDEFEEEKGKGQSGHKRS